jgi:hypothetical protein
MGSLALRRTKDSPGADGRPLVTLPSKTVTIVRLELGPEDALNYARLESETKTLVGVLSMSLFLSMFLLSMFLFWWFWWVSCPCLFSGGL